MLPPSVFIDAGEELMGTEISGGGVMGGGGIVADTMLSPSERFCLLDG